LLLELKRSGLILAFHLSRSRFTLSRSRADSIVLLPLLDALPLAASTYH